MASNKNKAPGILHMEGKNILLKQDKNRAHARAPLGIILQHKYNPSYNHMKETQQNIA